MSGKEFERYTHRYAIDHPGDQEEIAKEHLHRVKLGVEKWNDWNNKFESFIKENNIKNPFIDFSKCTIETSKFSNFEFACDVHFKETHFTKPVYFKSTVFSGVASFSGAKFTGVANFSHSTFSSEAFFSMINFMSHTYFNDTQFYNFASFINSSFSRFAVFRKSQFSKQANFINVVFSNSTSFEDAIFGIAPNFHQCELHSDTNFDRCQFIDVKSSFATRNYRTLKLKMGEQRSTTEEAMFYALEQKSKYFHHDTKISEKITSFAYEKTSDYGQSIIRPIIVLGLLTLVFFFVYSFQIFSVDVFKSPDDFRSNFIETIQFTIRQIVKPFNIWSINGVESIIKLFGGASILFIQIQCLIQSLLSIIPVTLFVLAIRRKFRMN